MNCADARMGEVAASHNRAACGRSGGSVTAGSQREREEVGGAENAVRPMGRWIMLARMSGRGRVAGRA
jgi:hypothetical protein